MCGDLSSAESRPRDRGQAERAGRVHPAPGEFSSFSFIPGQYSPSGSYQQHDESALVMIKARNAELSISNLFVSETIYITLKQELKR